jgi:nitroreductase
MTAIATESLRAIFTEAHTAHSFVSDTFNEDALNELYEVIKFAPTSMNSQPLRILFVRDSTVRERLLTHLAEGNKTKTAAAPLVAILAFDGDFHEPLSR